MVASDFDGGEGVDLILAILEGIPGEAWVVIKDGKNIQVIGEQPLNLAMVFNEYHDRFKWRDAYGPDFFDEQWN